MGPARRVRLWAAAAALVLAPRAARACQSALDCELNGVCEILEGKCKCKSGWEGPTCGTLSLGAATRLWPPAASGPAAALEANRSAYAWGFSHLAPSASDNYTSHGFVNVGCYLCAAGMVDGTLVAHVRAAAPQGPYELVGVALPINAFNPHAVRLTNGSVALAFRSHTRDPPTFAQCIGAEPRAPCAISASEFAKRGELSLALAPGPYGPWEVQPLRIEGWEHVHVSNPSLVELAQGAGALLAYRFDAEDCERVAVARATSVRGPFRHLANLSTCGEDPFLWQDRHDSSLHIIFHVEDERAYSEWPSLHAFSGDGGRSWGVSASPDRRGAYSTSVLYGKGEPGERFQRRERPELVLDLDGRPQWLLSAVMRSDTHQVASYCRWGYSFSLAQSVLPSAGQATSTAASEQLVSLEQLR